ETLITNTHLNLIVISLFFVLLHQFHFPHFFIISLHVSIISISQSLAVLQYFYHSAFITFISPIFHHASRFSIFITFQGFLTHFLLLAAVPSFFIVSFPSFFFGGNH
ncbi:hypothetical protein BC829DRAFT_394742, partial [Chytridium lagenaria]